MHHLPLGTVTLLFTDIEGSTRLLEQLGEHYPDVLAECRHLLRTAFHVCGGQEVDTQGDAFFVAFARATDAISAVVAAQRALVAHAWPNGVVIRVRMGLHTGEPQFSAESYVGLDVAGPALPDDPRLGGARTAGGCEPPRFRRTSPQRPRAPSTSLSARHCGFACRLSGPQDSRRLCQQPARSVDCADRA